MSDTKIEWADKVWNPIAGCTKCSPGCLNCYAERMAKRLYWMGMAYLPSHPEYMKYEDGWKDGHIELLEHRLEQPLKWKKPCRIFVCSMSDLFHEKVPFEYISKVFSTIQKANWHTHLILTKRPERIMPFMKWHDERTEQYVLHNRLLIKNPFRNLHLGVSVSNIDEMENADVLADIPAVVRWISFEPLLEDVGVIAELFGVDGELNPLIHGVVVGGESGPGARPMHPDWVRNIRDQCVAAGVPFYFKQWGEWEIANKENAAKHGYIVADGRGGILTPYNEKKFVSINRDGSYYRDNPQPDSVAMARVGKKNAGCLLDGKEWKQLPERR